MLFGEILNPNWLKHAQMLGSSFCLEVSVLTMLSGEVCTSAAASVQPCLATVLCTTYSAPFLFVHLVLLFDDTHFVVFK